MNPEEKWRREERVGRGKRATTVRRRLNKKFVTLRNTFRRVQSWPAKTRCVECLSARQKQMKKFSIQD